MFSGGALCSPGGSFPEAYGSLEPIQKSSDRFLRSCGPYETLKVLFLITSRLPMIPFQKTLLLNKGAPWEPREQGLKLNNYL